MIKKYDKKFIDRNINIDIIDMMADGMDSKLTASELLPVAAASVTRFEYESTTEIQSPLYKSVGYLLKRKVFAFSTYNREGTINALEEKWSSKMERQEMERLLLDVHLIESFTEDGYAIFNEKMYNAYRNLMAKNRFNRIEYGVSAFVKNTGDKWEEIVRLSKGTILEKHRLWSWKCTSTEYENGYPDEMCCVGKNEWHDGPLTDIKREEAGRRGSVSRAWYDFAQTIKEGDFVLLRDYQKNVIAGIGRFVGPYRYESNYERYRSRRSVEWISTRLILSPFNIGVGNTSPMLMDDPRTFPAHLEIIQGELGE